MNKYRIAIIGAGHRAGAHDRESLEKGQSPGSHAWAYQQVEEWLRVRYFVTHFACRSGRPEHRKLTEVMCPL